jgi:hypothetical protein
LLYQKLARKKQDGKENKSYDINSCLKSMPKGKGYGSMKKIKKGGKK